MKRGLRRAGIVGLSTLVATSMMSIGAVTAQADWAATPTGEIGLRNTNMGVVSGVTNGAQLVMPGVSGQALGDIRLLIPNSFKNGDIIDLTVFDRTATATNAGTINADAAHMLGFTGAPAVSVNPNPYIATHLGPNALSSNSVDGSSTGVPPAAVVDTGVGHATQPPVFTTTVAASSRANGLATDIIRLTVNGVQAAGANTTDDYVVTLSGIKANVGGSVSPGELRVVPFAYNAQPSGPALATPLFAGNMPPTVGFNPVIHTYTVPAYVSPVSFNIGAPNNIVADGTVQSVGDIKIAETNNYSLQNGTYTVAVGGATIENSVSSPMTVSATGLAVGETVVKAGADNVISFTVAGASNTSKISITIAGLLLSNSGSPGPISYTLSGGSISAAAPGPAFLVTAGTSAAIGTPPPPTGVAADSAFSAGVNQTDIAAPPLVVNAFSSDVIHRIGGNDRYETAAKIALNNGANDYVVLASGANWPDALSSGYLANQIGGGSILLTQPDAVPVVTATTMRELGTRTVYIVGGTDAVSAAVEAQLKATPQYYFGGHQTVGQGKLDVVRLGGATRYETNMIVNQYGAAMGGSNPVGRTSITFGASSKLTAFVATGENYPDALAVGPGTNGANGGVVSGSIPLILTPSSGLNAVASAQISNLGIQQAVIAGGTNAVSAGVATSLSGMSVAVDRLGGANRYSTATLVADFEIADVAPTATIPGGLGFDSSGGPNSQTAYLARGDAYPDALAAAPLAGGNRSPLLLTDPTNLSTETGTWLTDNAAAYKTVIALGLGQAISNAVLDAANAAVATS